MADRKQAKNKLPCNKTVLKFVENIIYRKTVNRLFTLLLIINFIGF